MAEHSLNACSLICPLPVLKARKVLLRLPVGDVLRVTVTDKAAPKDFKFFCAESGNILQSVHEQGEVFEIVVVRGNQI